ncbi:exonuclease [Lentinus tigrinus ALCF2SS1-7]|uniref:Mitochondrial escape protein 2 n=1 Tax=Lentinus tigrinus ALCF2SS1-6 TaxID=1328759 RepID=A0A5C2SRA7_9APHY|nr:exonuclease [Lentinus tigrinus ALCF2SS1-6]RPD79803.1 exonuclease [Lentinus tigrinus ALCF2SS1-7]
MASTNVMLKTLTASSSKALLGPRSIAVLARQRRHYTGDAVAASSSEVKEEASPQTQESWLWVDSVFPVSLGRLDVRSYIGYAREDTLLERLRTLLSTVNTHGFKLVSLEPHMKDGGVFVKFRYSASDTESALDSIVEDIRKQVHSRGGVPSWCGLPSGEVWLVKGSPWREDLNRYASVVLRVAFDGPDIPEESLYRLLRPFGRIHEITPPSPVPAGNLRFAMVNFLRLRSATSARNTIHALKVPTSSSAFTTLRTSYARPIAAHAVRDYIASHPRIFLPVLFFLVGTVTYAIFDPIRVFMVEGKMNDWFDYKEFTVYKWIRANTIDRFTFTASSDSEAETSLAKRGVWKERLEAEAAIKKYLTDMPNTIAFVHGPQGSGKTRMLSTLLKESGRKAMVIDVGELSKATSESALVSGLASQTGYWPVFSFLNSINNMIDLASVGIIGQKAGLSSSLPDQLKQILEVVGRGLARGNASHKARREREAKQAEQEVIKSKEAEALRERIQEGLWHDGRIDAVCGNGVMSELGVGVERFTEADADLPPRAEDPNEDEKGMGERIAEDERKADEAKQKQQRPEDLQIVESMPVVIIKNFESKGGGQRKEELLNVLAQWAANLAENQTAHVIVVSDNRENIKRLAKALPSKPLAQISLSDADNASALSFVEQKLRDGGMDVKFSQGQLSYIERLGGRASDLESLVHKVRSGMTVEEAVDDIVTRGVSELRKNAFGDDIEDAKSLPWTREQAWILMKQLSKQPEISYHEVLVDFPFKGDETPLRHMEHAELITIGTVNGRPSTIKPGKPVYKFVFERLVGDSVFKATQDIAFNEKVIAASETIVKACEQELLVLKDVDAGTANWWGSKRAVEMRANYLLKKMRAAEQKVENLERENAQLKKTLANARR